MALGGKTKVLYTTSFTYVENHIFLSLNSIFKLKDALFCFWSLPAICYIFTSNKQKSW